jgi:RecB family exonuclease
METVTYVLSSARAIRHELLSHDNATLFLPNYITIYEFFSKLTLLKDRINIDEDTRVLLLLEASNFENFHKLQIERNFFTFVKNSSYIFKFFSELSAELYDINQLIDADVYGEYEEHILILQELYKRYKEICDQRSLLDPIFTPELYEFNHTYAKSHKKVQLHIDGYLTNFECQLLEQASQYITIELVFAASRFNKKMQDKLISMGYDIKPHYKYLLSFNTKQILSQTPLPKAKNIICESFSESLLQIGFIKQKVYEFIKKGYSAKNIAVVLPNESSALLLKSFDNENNFNFAMGESFVNTHIYKKLNAARVLLDQDSKENYARVQRVGDEIYTQLSQIYTVESHSVNFLAILESFVALIDSKEEEKIYKKELYSFEKLLPYVKDMNIKSLMNLFLSRLSKQTIDDTRGGDITVMGVLETRNIAFDAVILIDFDDKNVPKRSDKDMFLNTHIRTMASLPTISDRENLQKHYYDMLINSAKELAISFVSSDQSNASRFLKQLQIKPHNYYNEKEYAKILFDQKVFDLIGEDEIVVQYSFDGVSLSNTMLKSYLGCKRKFYFQYIKKISPHEIPKDMPQEHEIGTAIHLALKNLYSKRTSYSDPKDLRRDLYKEMDSVEAQSELEHYLIELQKKKLEGFIALEIQNFQDGWEVLYCEKSFEVDFHGMKLSGQIDRIDKKVNAIRVLDYKTGSYKIYNQNNFMDATDFQLEFYYLLASSLGDVNCAFYDLAQSCIVPESLLQEKLAILQSHIEDMKNIQEIHCVKCEDTKECLFCPYKLICNR